MKVEFEKITPDPDFPKEKERVSIFANNENELVSGIRKLVGSNKSRMEILFQRKGEVTEITALVSLGTGRRLKKAFENFV